MPLRCLDNTGRFRRGGFEARTLRYRLRPSQHALLEPFNEHPQQLLNATRQCLGEAHGPVPARLRAEALATSPFPESRQQSILSRALSLPKGSGEAQRSSVSKGAMPHSDHSTWELRGLGVIAAFRGYAKVRARMPHRRVLTTVVGNPDLVAPVPCHLFTALVEEDQTLWLRN